MARIKILWLILLLSAVFPPCVAQRMRVEEFGRYKKPLPGREAPATDKQHALLDLFTNEKGFRFLVDNAEVPAAEGDGCFVLTLPHRTASLTIKHPDYGQLNWKVPGGELKRKKHYHAYLHTESLEKEFRQPKQWLLLSVEPQRAIVCVDSLTHLVTDGRLTLYLPLGRHACRIESPFCRALADTLELTDTGRLEKHFVLQPYYAYLTVASPLPDAQICLDGKPIGTGRAESGRLMPGPYRVSLVRGDTLYYDRRVQIANAERKVLALSAADLRPRPKSLPPADETAALPDTTATDTTAVQLPADVHITAFDADTDIYLNREPVGRGEWSGRLMPGFYSVSSAKEGLESRTDYFWVESGKPLELNLISPLADYGMLNIACNEPSAAVYLNGVPAGLAPCVLRNLPADRSYRLRLVNGRKTAETLVQLRGNDIVDIYLELKEQPIIDK